MKKMKTVTPKKEESNVLKIPAPALRLRKPPQRAATFKSGKEYSRKAGKSVPAD